VRCLPTDIFAFLLKSDSSKEWPYSAMFSAGMGIRRHGCSAEFLLVTVAQTNLGIMSEVLMCPVFLRPRVVS
jgi:hypothetical protein